MNSAKTFWTLLNVVLVIVILFGIKFLFSGDLTFNANRAITVSAEGKTAVIPDIARISFSVVSEGKDPKVIQDENAKKMNDAIAFVKSFGVKAEDIKTSAYTLYPQYDYGVVTPDGKPKPPMIVGYTLTQTVSIKVRDFSKIGDILGGLPGKGVNQIDQVGFDVDDQDSALAAARQEAFTKARAKAQAMAGFAGARLGSVMTFSEGYGGGVPIFYKAMSAESGRGGVATPAPTIEPGTQDVTVTVNVTYELR